MKLYFNNQISACYAALKEAKSIEQKMLLIEKFRRAEKTKEVRFSGNLYSWKGELKD